MKGVNASARDTFGIKEYKDVLLNRNIKKATNYGLRSDRHKVYSHKQDKIALSPFDDKRDIKSNGIITIPWKEK